MPDKVTKHIGTTTWTRGIPTRYYLNPPPPQTKKVKEWPKTHKRPLFYIRSGSRYSYTPFLGGLAISSAPLAFTAKHS